MNSKNLFNLLALSVITATFYSCKKEECHECHYDKGTEKIELGEKCGDELERLEAEGYTDATGNYIVHCHEEHD